MTPKGTFIIAAGETKTIEVGVYALDRLRKKTGVINFAYQIYGENSGIQEDNLLITIMPIQEALEIGVETITPNSTQAEIFINNKVNSSFDVEAEFSSAFFSFSGKINFEPSKTKIINITLDREKLKTLIAGNYILTADFNIEGKSYKVTGDIKYAEQEEIKTKESVSGFFFRKNVIEKTNTGNIPVTATFNIRKNILSRLFTTFNFAPSEVNRQGIFVYYLFQKELKPGETYTLKVTTSWIYPIILLLIVSIITYLVYAYTRTELVLKKRISFLKTKEHFALKVYLTAKARAFVEKIEISDKIPALVKIYEKFLTPPDKVDYKRNRIGWKINSLHPGEERVFSYIIYSKVVVIGKFELPRAIGIYEREGKLKQAFSNRTSFLHEPVKGVEYKGE